MKKPIISLIAATCITLSSATIVLAKPGHAGNDDMRMYMQLDLSDQQRQDIKTVIKTAHQDNSIYAVEKQAFKTQMQTLMNMPTWDAAQAESLIRSQLSDGSSIALNRAKARHQIYMLLTAEQQLQLNEKASDREARKNRHRKHKANDENAMYEHSDETKLKDNDEPSKSKMNLSRASKALQLSDAQKAQLKVIRKDAKENMQAFRQNIKTHRDTIKTIIQQPEFDEQAWLTAQSEFEDTIVAQRLIHAKVRYDSGSILTDEQKLEMAKIAKLRKEKHGNAGMPH